MGEHTFEAGSDEAEAAFRRGRALLAAGDREAAEALFGKAARLDALDAPWRIAQAYLEAFDARAVPWMRRAVASLNRSGGVTVDSGTLPIITVNSEDHEFLLSQVWCVAVTDCDPQVARAALRAAKPSVGQATEDGRIPTDDEIDSAPYYANSSWIDEERLTMTLDAKDQILPMLARVVLTVLVEELRRAGATRARLHTPRSAWPRY